MTDSAMLAFVLRRLRTSVVFLAPFAKIQRRLLKTALNLFGSADAAPRVQAVLLVRAMALTLPPPAMEACLKGAYRAFASNAKFVNATSAPHINFMASCVVELYGLDAAAAYQHAFGFIRQLAVLLRQALTSKSKESFREVYCWQTINCLELWAKVLSAHADSEGLRPLIHPLVQILLGTARLVPTPAYFPLRLRCTRALNKLAQATGVFIPVAPLCLEILQWGDLARAPKPAPGDKSIEVSMQLRAGKSALRSAAFQEEVVEGALGALADHLSQWSCHVAFPELAHLTLVQLRRFAKTTSVDKFRRGARQLADATERTIAFVGRARDRANFAPKDLQQASEFLSKEANAGSAPIVQHAATLRERAAQRAALRRAEEVEIGDDGDLPRFGKRGGEDSSDDDDDDDDAEELEKELRLPKKRSAAAAVEEEEEEVEEEASEQEEDGGSDFSDDSYEEPPQKQPRGGTGSNKKMKKDAFVDGEDDQVGAFELSDDDDDDNNNGGGYNKDNNNQRRGMGNRGNAQRGGRGGRGGAGRGRGGGRDGRGRGRGGGGRRGGGRGGRGRN